MGRSLACVLALLAFSPVLRAQATQTESKDNCNLSVRVRTSDERSINTPIQVEVLSPEGVVGTAHVVGGEPAEFRVTSGKTYRVAVSGIGLEPVTSSYFEINALEMVHTETVHVKAVKQDGEESTPGTATISVTELNVPKKARTDLNKGLEAYAEGDMDKATAQFEKAIAEYPRYARAYDMLGVIAIKESNRSKAREMFAKSMEAESTFLPAYVDLARLDLQDQDYAGAESLLRKVIAANPSMPDAMALLASTEFANKEYEKALADVQRTHALRNHEQFAEVHIMAGKVLSMENRRDEAIAEFEFFLKEKPQSPQAESVRKMVASLQRQQP